jgi:solute carrier family 35 (UDP-sugar transporter), member A1/2/3
MKLEYVALANLNAAVFSVLVQTKLLFTAIMAYAVLNKKLKYIQIISLVLLTVGVMHQSFPIESLIRKFF